MFAGTRYSLIHSAGYVEKSLRAKTARFVQSFRYILACDRHTDRQTTTANTAQAQRRAVKVTFGETQSVNAHINDIISFASPFKFNLSSSFFPIVHTPVRQLFILRCVTVTTALTAVCDGLNQKSMLQNESEYTTSNNFHTDNFR